MPFSHRGAMRSAGSDDRRPRTSVGAKGAWFVGIWVASVLALGVVAFIIRWALMRP